MSEAGLDLRRVRDAILAGNVRWQRHALQRMRERRIARSDVFALLQGGEVIEVYSHDTPYPSGLVLGYVGHRALHVVVGLNPDLPEVYIITVYEPGLDKFEPDWRTRRKS